MRSATSPRAVRQSTGVRTPSWRSRLQRSRPSPSGSMRSRTITSWRPVSAWRSPVESREEVSTAICSERSARTRRSRVGPLSSMTRTFMTASPLRAGSRRLGERVDHPRDVLRVFEIQVDPQILVRRVRARIRVAKSGRCHGNAKLLDEGMVRSGASDHRHDRHPHPVHRARRLRDETKERVVGIGSPRRVSTQKTNLNVGKTLRVEMGPQLPLDLVRSHVWNEAEVHLGGSLRREHGLAAWALIAGRHSTYRASRLEHFGDLELHSPLHTPEILLHSVPFAVVLGHVGGFRHELPVPRGGGKDRVVEAGDPDALVLALEARQRPGEAPGGVGEDRASDPRMHVAGEALHGELHVADAAKARVLEGHLVMIHVAEFPEAGVPAKPLPVLSHEAGQVNAPDLLLPFDHELDAARKTARLLEERIEREQPRREVPLVVAHAAAKEASVTARGSEGRAGPELERLRRLHA